MDTIATIIFVIAVIAKWFSVQRDIANEMSDFYDRHDDNGNFDLFNGIKK